jgi:hypothetical protein
VPSSPAIIVSLVYCLFSHVRLHPHSPQKYIRTGKPNVYAEAIRLAARSLIVLNANRTVKTD